jgi:DNA helicase-2/ATP-dependent DNA helicase PcrA
MQIIACAGAGKTETVSQRVASLIAEGVAPRSIVAFTFTERAASELKERIAKRVSEIDETGNWADTLTGLFVGTIHAYCFRLLQQQVPRFETYEVLDDNRLTAFLAREGGDLGLRELGDGKLYEGIDTFLEAVSIVENELIPPDRLPKDFRDLFNRYLSVLEDLRVLSYGQQIAGAVKELEKPALQRTVHESLRHLIVDEYQDINPAQERLIELLVGPHTELCVVGDDDQAIYQWRGSDVKNILEFDRRWKGVKKFVLDSNYRSLPHIVDEANEFAVTIRPRLAKSMKKIRKAPGNRVVAWYADREIDEAGYIAQHILDLTAEGVPYSDIAILVRSSTAFPRLVESLSTLGIPVRPAGRIGLFSQPEARALSRAFLWLTTDYRAIKHSKGEYFDDDDVFGDLDSVFSLNSKQRRQVRSTLERFKKVVPDRTRQANLVSEYYELLETLGVKDWDFDDLITLGRLGTLARFGAVLEDYESVTRRARPDRKTPGNQMAGSDRGHWFYKNLADYINRHGAKSYTDFGGEEDSTVDAIDLTTIHQAKGLEWPVVFIPSLTARFKPKESDPPHPLLDPASYDHKRYASNDPDERRVFYVAMTRGRDWVNASRHERVNTKATSASPYYDHLAVKRKLEIDKDKVKQPSIERRGTAGTPLSLSHSQIAAFLECGLQFRLRSRVGFPTMVASQIGYGKAVHHVLRTVADITRAKGRVPNDAQIDRILDDSFFLPVAGTRVHQELKRAARNLITTYVAEHSTDLFRTWESERPFELRLPGATVSGRADVILDKEGEVAGHLALLDYKSSARVDMAPHILQLQVYALAGKREGLNVKAAYVHDLKAGTIKGAKPRTSIEIGDTQLQSAEETVLGAIRKIRNQEFAARPGNHCKMCDVRKICKSAK